ncbi:hypothetical protein [Robbsia andropogonis]|uniref:hypothetical protein n=1 Tax=Robbsia andropogonis TaxID=28092 RepID=UPI00209FADA3|nr:hypothetical protein [Robbsia andropogonis]MCP1121487.1 hypothetical protein [Robbsia andropogonis]MCP1131307.1 hypothetical protein [Robbsia andropogonis]
MTAIHLVRSTKKKSRRNLARPDQNQVNRRTTVRARALFIRVRVASRRILNNVTSHGALVAQSARRPARQAPSPLRCP